MTSAVRQILILASNFMKFHIQKKPFKIRNYRAGDFENYVQLHAETNKLDRSAPFISKQRLAENLGHPSFYPENDLFIAECDDSIIGYASIFLEAAIERALMDGMIHPIHRKKGIATELFHRTLGRAREADSKVVQICIPESNLPARNFLSRLGLKFIRHFFEMKLDLNNVRLPDVAPDEYTIRSLGPDEADKLTFIQNRAFADSWGFNPNSTDEIAYRINLSCSSPENIMVACLKDLIVGYCWMRLMVDENPAAGDIKGEIHMLGVDPDFRRQGIGRRLLLAGLSHLKTKGVPLVELTADGEEPAALALYESVGFEIYSRIEWYEKRLD